ncbi:hypothetical protein BH11MYX3_BH11MYX3_42570 [soil metagenome]
MRSAILLVAALGIPACFYQDPINQRPAIDILASGDEVYRGDTVELTASANDPEHHFVKFTWRAYACTDGAGGADCDVEPFYDSILDHAEFLVPLVREDQPLPVRNVRVVLEAKDELGATAKPAQELVIVTLDRPPELELARAANFIMTPGRDLIVYATVGDVDDGPIVLGKPTWEVFAPSQAAYVLTDLPLTQNPSDPEHRTYAKTFRPSVIGEWELRVTSTDPLDKSTTKSLFITVAPPPPPCLTQYQPIVPTGGAALPISDATLFRVPIVIDDLDVYPPQTGDAALGVTRFQWSFQGPGAATHTPVSGATASSFALDPATFTPGDLVEVRVEIYDRENTPIVCPDADPSCSTISMPSCIQRQTWRVEIR